ncbi:coiled-coil alpha-helical rod protein 1 isoform X2 [Parambassis ranga]|uniref:Coiled-coil alpha-helical rod protein 1 n=1 Tax=Parambassis ranga TaxID=210632 RepID=A0A6P7JN50_9TELE|nr:coiled-coil alpha-helical rod protein 1-like isoform X2 [Parambassis ranga]
MERHNLAKEKLIVPTDFTSPAASKTIQEDLIPPSHFASSIQSAGAHRGVQTSTAPPAMSWINPGVTSGPSVDPSPVSPWLAISQAQQEILELRNENQRIMMLQGESMRGRTSGDPLSHLRTRHTGESEQWARWESEWRLEAEKHMAKAERLKGQVESLKETAERYREEMRDKDITLNRHCNELEAMREEISKSKTELSQMREELNLSNVQKEKIRSQLERLKAESSEEITKLRGDVENSKEESRELALSAEMCKMQAEEEARQQTLRLSEQLKEMQKKQEVELQCLNASHCAELSAVRKANKDLQDRLQSMTSEVLQLKSTLMDVSTERDGLKNHLSKMGQAFETQSATLHSLRNYIGQLAPEKGDKDQLNETVEKLTKEKAALQMTTELLTVRLNSVNEILALQEEKMVKKASTDPLVKNGLEGLQVLQLWREKVFKLCVQLRSKDIELRGEKDKLVSELRSMEQQLQQEHHRANVLQHSLHDRIAELDLERVGKETLKQDLAKAYRENAQLTSQNQKTKAELTTLTEAVQSFSQAFQSKVAEVDAAKSRLNTFTQRLTFAKRRVETIQGLVMRKVALQKVEQACKQSEKAAYSIRNLQAEHSLVCEERDKLAQELKRTPELIEKTLADLKEQYESKVRQQQQELEQSWEKVRQAVAQREETEQSLQQIQVQLEESKVNLEKLHCELLSQKELSEQALLERVSEIEYRCAEKLREMELQVNTARREHTKAVMTLRQFERGRTQNEMEERTQNQSTKRGALNAQLKETAKDKNLLVTVAAGGLSSECKKVHTTLLPNSAPRKQGTCSIGETVRLPADEKLLCVLEELHTLSAAVVNSSEESAEEEEDEEDEEEEEEGASDSVLPSTGSLHS